MESGVEKGLIGVPTGKTVEGPNNYEATLPPPTVFLSYSPKEVEIEAKGFLQGCLSQHYL